MNPAEQMMKEILIISEEGARIGCGAMDWIFEQTDKIDSDKAKLFTYLMALANPELDSMVSEALVHFAMMRAANG